MARTFRRVTKRVFVFVNIIVVWVFLLACLNVFLPPARFWYIAILGLGFPFLLIFVFGFFIFWIVFRSRWALLSLFALILGFPNIRALVGVNFANRNVPVEKTMDNLRVLSWNVTWFDEQARAGKGRGSYRKDMLAFIKSQNADILCFQEYLEPNRANYHNNMKDITALGFPYHLRAIDYRGGSTRNLEVGVIIFSKYPIVDSIHIQYPGPAKNRAAESLIGADIMVGSQRIRVFNTHLQSVLFKKDDYRYVKMIQTGDEKIMEASKSIVRKLKQGYTYRGDQVDIVRKALDESPFPEIICGDFNDVPNSYTYFQIKGDRQDAFVEKSSGIGRTFYALSPTLRIDFIMADPAFEVRHYYREVLPYSDHYPLVVDLKLEKD